MDVIGDQDATDIRHDMRKTVISSVFSMITIIFVALYGASLLGWLRPLSDITMITRLEPVIFVIIGYYFGRLPALQNERTLREEISRAGKMLDATRYAKEQAEKERDVMEERIRNAHGALRAENDLDAASLSLRSFESRRVLKAQADPSRDRSMSVGMAMRILNCD